MLCRLHNPLLARIQHGVLPNSCNEQSGSCVAMVSCRSSAVTRCLVVAAPRSVAQWLARLVVRPAARITRGTPGPVARRGPAGRRACVRWVPRSPGASFSAPSASAALTTSPYHASPSVVSFAASLRICITLNFDGVPYAPLSYEPLSYEPPPYAYRPRAPRPAAARRGGIQQTMHYAKSLASPSSTNLLGGRNAGKVTWPFAKG